MPCTREVPHLSRRDFLNREEVNGILVPNALPFRWETYPEVMGSDFLLDRSESAV
jgi:hypothetical protein